MNWTLGLSCPEHDISALDVLQRYRSRETCNTCYIALRVCRTYRYTRRLQHLLNVGVANEYATVVGLHVNIHVMYLSREWSVRSSVLIFCFVFDPGLFSFNDAWLVDVQFKQ